MSRQTPSLSFEVFPPNPEVGNDKIIAALKDMQGLAPHFISVTASNNKFNIKETTVRLADYIQNDLEIPTIAHLPAIYLTKDKVAETIADLDKVGVQKILALRGDIIPGVEPQKDSKSLSLVLTRMVIGLLGATFTSARALRTARIKSLRLSTPV